MKNNQVQPCSSISSSKTKPSIGGGEILTIGIVKNTNSDVLFSKFPNDLLSFDNMVNTAPYQLFQPIPILLPGFEKEILEPINGIINAANGKRLELYHHLSKNPYFPWYKRKTAYFSHCYYSTMWYLRDIPHLGEILVSLGSIFIGFPLFLLSFIQYLFYYLLDILFCRLNVCRGSLAERKIIQSIIEEFPHLDTGKIDTEIKLKMNDLLLNLQEKLPQVIIQIKTGQEEIIDEKNVDFYFHDYFYLLFEILENTPTNLLIV